MEIKKLTTSEPCKIVPNSDLEQEGWVMRGNEELGIIADIGVDIGRVVLS